MNLSGSTRARLEQLGARGVAWVRGLPERVRALEDRFACQVEEALDGGSAAFVSFARLRDGTRAVLKVAVPAEEGGPDPFDRELAVLAGANPEAYVALLAHDRERRAFLLESLGTPMARAGLAVEHQLDALGRTIALGWRKADAAPGLPSGLDQIAWLEELLAADATHAPENAAAARALLERRRAAFDPARAVVIHGDAHPSNVLAASFTGWKMIDPEGLISTPEHDLGIPLREWNAELLTTGDPAATLAAWVRRMARAAGFPDVAAIWEWAFIERVTSGLFLRRLGLEAESAPYLAVADRLRSAGSPRW